MPSNLEENVGEYVLEKIIENFTPLCASILLIIQRKKHLNHIRENLRDLIFKHLVYTLCILLFFKQNINQIFLLSQSVLLFLT